MFTGIVQAMGRITEVAKGPSAARLVERGSTSSSASSASTPATPTPPHTTCLAASANAPRPPPLG